MTTPIRRLSRTMYLKAGRVTPGAPPRASGPSSGAQDRRVGFRDEIVSMDMWGFTPTRLSQLRAQSAAFFEQHGRDGKAEFYIPAVVNNRVSHGRECVKVRRIAVAWFGVTCRKAHLHVRACIHRLIRRGEYPERLWA